jgi:uncharacterized protein (DUF1501 family)
MRKNIAIPSSSTLPLDGFFGLHPKLPNFANLYSGGEAAIVHATCVPLRNRSHFDAQDNLENGMPGRIVPGATGWINRLLESLPAGAPVRKAGAIQIGEAPLIMRGPASVLGWSPTWFDAVENPTLGHVRSLYRGRDPQMHDMLERGLEANKLANRVDQNDGDISSLRKAFRGAGRLLAAADGPRIAVLSVGGWDTHADQGATTGQLAGLLGELDDGMGDFRSAIGSAWADTVAVLATEFGRTVRINGDGGTDHGVGTVALLAGGAVQGGKVFGDWPGLAPNQLYEKSDLRATTDLRSVFKGVLRDHLGVPTNLLNKGIFPESAKAAPLSGMIKSGGAAGMAVAAVQAPARKEAAIARYRREQRMAEIAAN